MTKQQVTLSFSALALFLGLYFGFNTKPVLHNSERQSQALGKESAEFESLLKDARTRLSSQQSASLSETEKALSISSSESEKILLLKKISGQWHRFGNLPVSGVFAEQTAVLENADSSWSVAGATFFEALIAAEDSEIRDLCAKHAIKAFESAASLNPNNVQHRVNLALVYAENPPPDKPMTAALMLRELAEKHPDNPAPFNALGRLAIKTGQWQRAIERLERSWELDKNNPNTPCLLAKAYEGLGDTQKALDFAKRCK